MKITKLSTLTKEIIAGTRLKPEDDIILLLEAPLDELQSAAGEVQRFFCGRHVDLCTILNGRSGRCSEDCKYCAQAAC
ncbi:MAG: biotin synthase BioB, partial [Selenomonas sp.]|nr:biotin synthase BioB [Selenomonas sp.]